MLDITEWCTTHLARVNKRDKEIEAECPWCGKFGAFNINRRTGAFRCYKCADANQSYGRTLVPLIVKVLEIDWQAAKAVLAEDEIERWRGDALTELPAAVRAARKGAQIKPKPIRVWHAMPAAEPVFDASRTPKWRMPRYLKDRGITREVARLYDLRTCFDGLYAGRLIMPMIGPLGRTFTARAMDGAELRYRNPSDAGHRFAVYGFEQVTAGADLIIVEGPFDVLRMRCHGFNVIGLLGKEMSKEQESLIKTLPRGTTVTLFIDPEERRAQYKIAKRLADYFETVMIAKLPALVGDDGKPIDPGSCTKEQATDALMAARRYTGDVSSISEMSAWVREASAKRRAAYAANQRAFGV